MVGQPGHDGIDDAAVSPAMMSISDRMVRLEVWRQADRERIIALEVEMRTAIATVMSKLDSFGASLHNIDATLSQQLGARGVWGVLGVSLRAALLAALAAVAGFLSAHPW